MKVQLILNLDIELNGTDPDTISENLEHLVANTVSDEMITGDSPATLKEWFHEVKDPNDKKTPALSSRSCDGKCPGWGVFNGREVQRCDTCQRFVHDDEAIAYVKALEVGDLRRHGGKMKQGTSKELWAVLQSDEQEVLLDCGCKLERRDDNRVFIRQCFTHEMVNPPKEE